MNESSKNQVQALNQDIFRVEHISKKFKLEAGAFARSDKLVYAVNDVSFSIKRGETYGLVGESGCGKTTTARMLIGMYTPDSGSILYTPANIADMAESCAASENAPSALQKSREETTGSLQSLTISDLKGKALKAYREKVKYIFQDPAKSLNPRMSVYDVLTTGLKYSAMWKGEKDARQKAVQIIEEVGLTAEDLEKRPAEFSGGQRQRISIARSLIMNPDFIICDEVVSALDVSIQAQILNLLSKIRRERNLSMLFITHDLKVACYFCDRIGVMYKGSLVEEGKASEIYKNAQNDYTKKLFAIQHGSLLSFQNLLMKKEELIVTIKTL